MPRLARKNIDTPFVHVMVQGVNKEYVFYKEEYIDKYMDIISKKMKDYDFEIIAYCIMNNHAHFLVYTNDIKEFGKFMQKVNLIYAQMYNREENRCGVLFRNRYQTEPIADTRYLLNCIKYIHNNPVKANMVSRCEDYKYSSYNDYMMNIGVSQANIMKAMFGKKCDYSKMFKSTLEKKFMDTDDVCEQVDDYILNGITEFKNNNKILISDIFEYTEVLENVIQFLKKTCNIKYLEIQKYLEIPMCTMVKLKKKK